MLGLGGPGCPAAAMCTAPPQSTASFQLTSTQPTCGTRQHPHHRGPQQAALAGQRGSNQAAEGRATRLDRGGQCGTVPAVRWRRLQGKCTHSGCGRNVSRRWTVPSCPSSTAPHMCDPQPASSGATTHPALPCPPGPTCVTLRPTAGHSGGKRSPSRHAAANISPGVCVLRGRHTHCEPTSMAGNQGVTACVASTAGPAPLPHLCSRLPWIQARRRRAPEHLLQQRRLHGARECKTQRVTTCRTWQGPQAPGRAKHQASGTKGAQGKSEAGAGSRGSCHVHSSGCESLLHAVAQCTSRTCHGCAAST